MLRSELSALDPLLKWRLVELLFKDKLGFNLGRKHSEALVSFIEQGREGLELPGGMVLRAKQGGIEFSALSV